MTRASLVAASATVLVFSLHVTPVYAQHGGAKQPHPATPQHGGSQSGAKSPAGHGSPHTTTSPKSSTHGSSTHATAQHSTTPEGQTKHGSEAEGSTHAQKAQKTSAKTTTAAASTPTTSGSTIPLTPVQQKLAKNGNLANKLQSRLPTGTDLQTAADGFRNLGQFVAAVNVSNNLRIPFDKLKTDMVTKHMSLGQSIQDLKPASSAAVEARHAEFEASVLIAETPEPTTTTSSTTTPSKTKKKTTGQ